MLKKYGILGSGTAADNVIEDGLTEIGEDNEFIVGCPAKPSAGMIRVLEWLIDREVRYQIICVKQTPEKFVDNASGCDYRATEEEINGRVLSRLQKENGSLLLLWDVENENAMEKVCFGAADFGVAVRDLCNGLVPLFVESDTQTPTKEKHVPTAEIEVEPLSREELFSMPLAMLRKTAQSEGVEITEHMTKEQIVNALTHAEAVKEMEEDYLPPIDLGTFRIISTRESVITTKEETCMLTVVFPSGIIMSRPATPYEAKQLFGFEPSTL